MFVDTETMKAEAIENPAATTGGGAGTQAAQLVASKGATAVLTGNIGPNAFSALDAAGIKMYVGLTGTTVTVREAIDKLSRGELQPVSEPTAARHSGMGGGRRNR